MFAFKQAVRSVARKFPTATAPTFSLTRSTPYWNLLLSHRHSPAFSLSQACFSCSSNWAAAIEMPSQQSTAVATDFQVEPDVLYHMIEIEIRCSDPVVLQSYNKAITLAAEYLGLTISHNEVGKRPHTKRWTVLKSRHIHKKHMVTYEVRTYHHKIQLERLTGSTADTFLEYIQRNLPEGISMRVGRVQMEKLPEHLLTPPSSDH